jgi:hypothetical protein
MCRPRLPDPSERNWSVVEMTEVRRRIFGGAKQQEFHAQRLALAEVEYLVDGASRRLSTSVLAPLTG